MGHKFKFINKTHGTGEAWQIGRHWTEYQPVPANSPVAHHDWCDICQQPQYVTPDGVHHCGESR